MTKEQAIEYLKADIKHWENTSVSTEHLEMAIKALEQQPSEDCVSREQALLSLTGKNLNTKSADELIALFDKRMKALPPVTPTHGTCKDCRYCEDIGIKGTFYCKRYGINHLDKYYCADFEKRGNENESHN